MGAPYQRGSILYQQKRYKMAIAEFHRELAESPQHAPARAMLALSLLYSGEKRNAWSTIQQLIGDAPTYAFGFYGAAHVAMAYALKERKWYDFGASRELKV